MNNKLPKNQFTLVVFTMLLLAISSCSVFRPGTTSGTGKTESVQPEKKGAASPDPRFLNTISTDNADLAEEEDAGPDRNTTAMVDNGHDRGKKPSLYRSGDKTADRYKDAAPDKARPGNKVPLSVLQLKYSMLTNTPVEKLDNQKLLEFMDDWYGVPYRFGGTTKRGIDCSAFTLNLMSAVYGVTSLPRMSRDQYAASEKISRKKLREGDLVFFHTYGKGKTVTHVGVYLYNNRFVHASVSGVEIDDLEGSYYSRHFIGAGRVL